MEVHARLITRQGVSLVRAKVDSLAQSVKKILMTVSLTLVCQTLIAKIWRMVTVVSVILLSLEILATSVSSKVLFNITLPFTKPADAIMLERSHISCLYRNKIPKRPQGLVFVLNKVTREELIVFSTLLSISLQF